MNTIEIIKCVDKSNFAELRKSFRGVTSFDRLSSEAILKPNQFLIVNSCHSSVNSIYCHWMLIIRSFNEISFFDSFGTKNKKNLSKDLLKFINRHKLNIKNKKNKKIVFKVTKRRVQASSSILCAIFCLVFASLKLNLKYSNNKILKYFHKKNYLLNDKLVINAFHRLFSCKLNSTMQK